MTAANTPSARRRATAADAIRRSFDTLSNGVLLDDVQVSGVLRIGVSTLKRWRAQGNAPASTRLAGMPRTSVGALRAWMAAGGGVQPSPPRAATAPGAPNAG